jgi:hypothetical protein
VPGDGVEGAELGDEVVDRLAGQQDVKLVEAVTGVGGAGQLADPAVQVVEALLGSRGVRLGALDRGSLPLEEDLGGVELLSDDLELVARLGDEGGGLLGSGGPAGIGRGGAG